MYCSNCGEQVQDNASFCTACGSKILHGASDAALIASPKAVEERATIDIEKPAPPKRRNVFLRILLCAVWFVFMAMVKVIMKKTGVNGIIPNGIYWAALAGVMMHIWRK